MRFLFVNKYKKGIFIVASTYESFHKYKPESVAFYKDALDQDLKLETEDIISIRDFYSSLCEFVHTNTDSIWVVTRIWMKRMKCIFICPQMIPDHLVYRAFPSTLLVTLDMYLVNMHAIYDNMEGVSKVCEETLKDR